MKPVELDLGSLEMKSTTSDVRLRLSSHAAFAPSAEGDVAALLERLTASGSDNNDRSRPWITCDNAFQLELSLSLEHLLTTAAQEDMVDMLVDRLKIAKLWTQLGMRVTSVEATSSNEKHHQIKIDLAIQQGHIKSTPRQLHKLTVPPPLDTRPPPGVCSAALRLVRLDLHIHRSEAPKRTKPKRLRIRRDTQPSENSDYLMPRSSTRAERTCAPSDDRQSHPKTTATAPPTISETGWILESDDEETADPDDELLLGFDVAEETLIDLAAPIEGLSLLKRSSSVSGLDLDNPTARNSDILELLDAAIRITISDCRRNLPKTVSLVSTESFRHHDVLVPSIWRSGYALAVGSRAVFLPTISHALNSVHLREVSEQQCTKGFEHANSYRPQGPAREQRRRKSKAIQATISAQLWHKLQRTAYKRSTAKKLKSLCFTSQTPGIDVKSPTDLLDSMELDFYASSFYSEDEALSDLFDDDSDDNDSLFNDDQSDTDLFDSEGIVFPDVAANSSEGLKSAFDADTIDIACSEELTMVRKVEQRDDDMLSICDSLGSSSLSEQCFEDFDASKHFAQNRCDLEEICI